MPPNDNILFGGSVAISGDYAIVGNHVIVAVPSEGGGDVPTNLGAAYVFRRTGLNVWDFDTKLASPNAQDNNDQFGESVSISGGDVIVGAPGVYAAYIFK